MSWGKRIFSAVAIELLVVPVAIVLLIGLYTLGLPGLEIVLAFAFVGIIAALVRSTLRLQHPKKTKTTDHG